MRSIITKVIASLILIALIVMGFVAGFHFSGIQIKALIILSIIAGSSMLYCFIVGEITHNNSQMDKLWSILPIIYAWIIFGIGAKTARTFMMAFLISVWGVRLTYNFAQKGAYTWKFWAGEEDYRWSILRNNPIFKGHKVRWALFDLLFISIYQNVLMVLIVLPMVSAMDSTITMTIMDYAAVAVTAFFIMYEIIADDQQMKFQTEKWNQINKGKKLEQLEMPYKLGFNTVGLWNFSRHPNYLGEQGIWWGIYLFTIGAGTCYYGVFNGTILGACLLVFLFMGSSTMAEGISSSKYPLYKDYQKKVFKYLPIRKYR